METIKKNKEICWEELCKLEPRLASLCEEARAIRRNRPNKFYQPDNDWYNSLKPRMSNLVGLGVKDKVLSTSEAYDIAYTMIYDTLRGRA